MDNHQHEALLKMFYQRRLDPSNPEHDVFIRAELAKLEVLEPDDAVAYKDFYIKAAEKANEQAKAILEDEKAQEANRKAVLLEELKTRLQNPEPDVIGEVVPPELKDVFVKKEEVKSEVKVEKPKKKSKKSSPSK